MYFVGGLRMAISVHENPSIRWYRNVTHAIAAYHTVDYFATGGLVMYFVGGLRVRPYRLQMFCLLIAWPTIVLSL
jgi:hypothetical protein